MQMQFSVVYMFFSFKTCVVLNATTVYTSSNFALSNPNNAQGTLLTATLSLIAASSFSSFFCRAMMSWSARTSPRKRRFQKF